MKWFLYAISLIWIAGGCCMILYTSETKNFMERMIKADLILALKNEAELTKPKADACCEPML
jgi:hypothetical protein